MRLARSRRRQRIVCGLQPLVLLDVTAARVVGEGEGAVGLLQHSGRKVAGHAEFGAEGDRVCTGGSSRSVTPSPCA